MEVISRGDLVEAIKIPDLLSLQTISASKAAHDKFGPNRHDRLVHFIYLIGPKTPKWSWLYRAAIQSAKEKGYTICLHSNSEPEGMEWIETKRHVDFLVEVDMKDYDSINGSPIERYMHRADILRLDIMNELGGIYMDLDMITLKEFPESFWGSDKAIFCPEHTDDKKTEECGLNNCILIGTKGLPIWKALRAQWDTFDHEEAKTNVGATSIEGPWRYSKENPNEVLIIHEKYLVPFHYSGWDPVHLFYHKRPERLGSAYTLHVWDSLWEKFLFPITKEHIMEVDTTFTEAIRYYVQD